MSTFSEPQQPAVTVVGDPNAPYTEQVVIDEATGEKLVIHADSVTRIDEIADQILGDH